MNNDWLLDNISQVFSELEGVVSSDHTHLQHLACLTLIVRDPNVLQESNLEELLKLCTLSIIFSFDRSLKDEEALG